MKEISIIGSGLSTICRLCLSSGVTLLDMFSFSSEMGDRVAGVIMKRSAVQITRGDEFSNFICQSCYTQLEKVDQFLTQIEQSDKALRRYVQQLYASEKSIKAECPVQPSEEPFFHNVNKDIPVKCESLELSKAFDTDLDWKETDFNRENKHNEDLCLKSESKVELINDNQFLTTDCENDPEDISFNTDDNEFSCEHSKVDIDETNVNANLTVNWREKKQENALLTTKLVEEISLKTEIKVEQIDDNLLILKESVDGTVNGTSNSDGNENICEDMKINIRHEPETSFLRSAKYEEASKNISVIRKNHKNQCDICNKFLSTRLSLYYHKRTHTGENPYQCDLCYKCFSQSIHLYEHKRIHTGEKPYHCDICNKCFSQSSKLNDHKRTHTGERPYQCDLCNKCFSQSSNLNRHKFRHTGEKPYHCDICNKCFSSLDNFNRHKLTHTGEKPYQCDLCNKSFSDPSNLNHHKRGHTSEEPYRCDICNKCFFYLSIFNRHKLTHTGEKPYQCDLCNKCFAQTAHLNDHKRTHSGERPYQCDLCNKCFSKSWNLNRHKLKHIGEKPYQCDLLQ